MTKVKLDGKVAIVTGAGQGAGMGAALAMAAEGAAVVLYGRTLSKVEKVAADIVARGGKAIPFGGDVTREADIAACIDLTLKTYGRIDILVNAAQSPEMRMSKLLDITREDIFELWNSGAAATLIFMRAVHPHMVQCRRRFYRQFRQRCAVRAGALRRLCRGQGGHREDQPGRAMEWARDGIRVNTVVPMVQSPASDADPTSNEALERIIPLGRIGDPEHDIGRPIAFLASEESAYITGSVLMLDGGLSYLS